MSNRFTRDSSASLLPWLLSILCAGSAFAACGGGGTGDPGGGGSTGANTGGSGAGTNVGGDAGGIGIGGGPSTEVLTIDPPDATITITSKGATLTQGFQALSNGAPVGGQVAWTLDSYASGTISSAGQFQTIGLVGGKVTVKAVYGQKTATALLTVKVDLAEDVLADPQDPGVSPPNKTALEGAPQPDPGAGASPPNPTRVLYPYDKTVMPRGLVAPLLQFSPGNLAPEDAKITISSSVFSWKGFVHIKNPGNPQLYVPQDIWDGAMQSAGGETLSIEVTKAVAGQAYGPAKTSVLVAPASLKGAVYYMTYEEPVGL